MRAGRTAGRSMPRLLAGYGLLTLVPVLALGVWLAGSFRSIATDRGVAEGRAEAVMIAQTAVEPELDGDPLASGLTAAEREAMERLVRRAVAEGHVLRLRLRDLAGRVVFADDNSGRARDGDDAEALSAARGHVVARLTHLNSDGNDDGPVGVASVEVYLPLTAGDPTRRVGVLEVYLPYAPIAADFDAGLHVLYVALGLGLAALLVALFLVTLSVSRGLRRELRLSAFLARHDTLTELPNRALFLERAKTAVAQAQDGRPSAIAIVDLDHFKDINDTLGHPTGDELLVQLARRVDAGMRPGDTVARLGGDEFGLILRNIGDAGGALLRLRSALASEVEVRGLQLSVEPSLGYVIVRDASDTVETLMQRADVAMYAAKAQHAGLLEYGPELARYDATDLEIASELRQAIDAGQLVLHYQPQADTASGEIKAVEALVRWQHPVHGLLGPHRFLPLAEQTDLIDRLTTWVLDTALRDAAALAAQGFGLSVAVNASARSIVRPEFAGEVIDALEARGVPPSRLIVEVTETALLTAPARAATVLSELSGAGVRISIDDFGQGQTSLGYLSALPVDELKIDRGFVTHLTQEPAQAAIVRSMIDLGHNLALRVVAEGIETPEVMDALRVMECDLAQGYLIARPMAVDALVTLLAANRAAER